MRPAGTSGEAPPWRPTSNPPTECSGSGQMVQATGRKPWQRRDVDHIESAADLVDKMIDEATAICQRLDSLVSPR